MADKKDDGQRRHATMIGNPPLCNARAKSTGKLCGRLAVKGYSKCHVHGGATPRGARSGKLSSGVYSKHCPQGLLRKYTEAEQDPELLSARGEVALLHARIGQLIERLHCGESGSLWSSLLSQVRRLETSNDPDTRNSVLDAVCGLVRRGATDEAQWRELKDTIDQKTKVSAHEWKRLIDMRQVITAERAMIFCMAVLDVVIRHVTDERKRLAISEDIQRLMARESGQIIHTINCDRPVVEDEDDYSGLTDTDQ